jgi:hypothetical protein
MATESSDGSAGSTPDPRSGEPDFSGTGCLPNIPTPVRVTARPSPEEAESGGAVRLVLEIHPSERSIVEHRNGQEFDFSVDRDGEEIWRWSTVAPFVDPYGYEFTYEPGRVRRFSAVWDQSPFSGGAPAGEYLIHGYLIGNLRTPPPEGRFICFDDSRLIVRGP